LFRGRLGGDRRGRCLQHQSLLLLLLLVVLVLVLVLL
jgi:hypothetical protein